MKKAFALLSLFTIQAFGWEYDEDLKLLHVPLSADFGRLSDGTLVALDENRNPKLQQTIDNKEEFQMDMVDEYYFTAQVTIGTPPMNGTLLVMDSSPFVTIYGVNCTGCGNTAFYDPANSTSYNATEKSFEVNDWHGIRANATIAKDRVCLVGGIAGGMNLCNDDQVLAMVNYFNTSTVDYTTFEFRLDGAFGLGRDREHKQGFLERAVENGVINANTWSYQPSGDPTRSGSMVIGGYDAAQIYGEITWEPSPAADYYWNSTMTKMMIANTTLWELADEGIVTFVTGYKHIGVPTVVWNKICTTLQNLNQKADGTAPLIHCGSDFRMIYGEGNCSEYAGMWNFTMQYQTDSIFVQSWRTFAFNREGPDGQTRCVWNFQNIGNKREIVIGEQFFKQFYTVFDGDNNQLGFGVSINSANSTEYETDGPWILKAAAPEPNKLSAAAITGISAGCVAAIVLVTVGIIKMKGKKPEQADAEEPLEYKRQTK